MNSFIYLAPVAGVIALIFAFYKAMTINKSEAGNDREMKLLQLSLKVPELSYLQNIKFWYFCSSIICSFRIWN